MDRYIQTISLLKNVHLHPKSLAKTTKAPPRLCPVMRAIEASHVRFRTSARQSSSSVVPWERRRKES